MVCDQNLFGGKVQSQNEKLMTNISVHCEGKRIEQLITV